LINIIDIALRFACAFVFVDKIIPKSNNVYHALALTFVLSDENVIDFFLLNRHAEKL